MIEYVAYIDLYSTVPFNCELWPPKIDAALAKRKSHTLVTD
jgi:hypothetical protein